MNKSDKRPSPIFGWVEAGTELVAAQVAQVTNTINKRIDESHAMLDELQHKGQEMDDKLRASLSPSSMVDSLTQLVKMNPLFALLPSFESKATRRDVQLKQLSAKVDLLVEQIALLAAKEAAEKKQQAEKASAPATSAAKKAPARKPRSGKTTVSTTAAPKKATARKPATRKPATKKAD